MSEQRIPLPGGEVTLTINGARTTYHLFYLDSNQSASLYPVDASGQKIANSSPLYVNGVWQRTEIQKDPSFIPQTRDIFNDTIKTAVQKYHRTTSGGAGPAPAWTQTPSSGQSQPPGAPNQNPQTPQNGNAPSNVFDFLGVAKAFIDTIKDPLDGITGPDGWGVQSDKYDFALDDAFNKIAQGGALRYPLDLLGNQDRLVISCYAYQPPYAASFNASLNDLFNGLQRTSAFKKQIKPNIYLPMPKDAKDSNAASWKEDNFSAISQAAITDIRQNFAAYGGALIGGNALGNILGAGNIGSLATRIALYARLAGAAGGQSQMVNTALGPILTSMLAGQMGFDISPETILSRAGGIVQNSNTELMFRGVGPMRSFTFTYRMSARGPTEANVIRTIIRALKQWSAPRKIAKISSGAQTVGAGSPSYFLGTPHIFQLKYVTNNGNLIAGVNRFKPCALTRISTNYAPDGEWNAFEGGQPVSIEMQLEFTELEPIYNTDYSNQSDPSRPDLIPLTFGPNSSYTDVGY